MSLLFNMLSRLVITFLPRSKRLLISWLQSPCAVILDPKKIKFVTVSIVSPSICHEVMGLDAMIFVFWMLSCFFFSNMVLPEFYSANRIVYPQGVMAHQPQRKGLNPSWLPPFISLSPPNPEPALCKLDWPWRGCICFTWSSHYGLWIFFCSTSVGFSLSLSFSHAILDSFCQF